MLTIVKLIDTLQLTPPKRLIFQKFAQLFHAGLPNSLYQNQYELTQLGGTPDDWEEFLNTPEISRFIQSKVAQLAEIAARRGLQQLESHSTAANAQAISALKELINTSKLLQNATNDNKQIVILHMPERGSKDEQTTDTTQFHPKAEKA